MAHATRLRRVAFGLAVVVLAGCGSTVGEGAGQPQQGAAALGSTQGPGNPSAGATAAAQAPGGAPQSGNGAMPGAAAGVGGSAAGVGPGNAPPTSTGSAGAAVAAPGVTPTTVYVGIPYSSQAAAGDKAIGAAGAAPSYDDRNVINAVIDYANRHGGFAGRHLKALYYDVNLTNDRNTQDEAACSYFTQDNKVLFMVTAAQSVLYACAAKAGAIAVDAGGTGNGMTYAQYPHLIDPDDIRLDRLGAVTVNGLYRAGYFTGKLGLVTWDDPVYRYTIANGYLPALRSHGITPVQTAYITVPQQIGALSDMSAAVSSAVTKFRSLGIDHVIIQDGPAGVWSGAGLTFEWMDQAKSQHYYPRYGQNSDNAPGWSVLPSDEMNTAIAVDDSDSDPRFDVGWHTNRQRQFCFKIQSDAGQPVSSSNQNDEGIAAIDCDIVFAIQRALNGASQITANTIVSTWQRFGTSLPSALVYGTKLVPGRRDAADMVRNEEYFASCQCLRFQGHPYYPD